ncbi:DUF481 domain-containing protein [Algoriphagus halophilus]|uniref:DUF481 domain-containing protein n=1 Tax=Algoriphagus halophilus TaxID=226505 RepID=A0A1N6HN08_9BACT|nr:DUF481 domain-containing protein [Algoriphagus halophilus]SIO21238.1 Protein of unknown function, DUF481 [Algoriphagus halophilus]
MGVINFLYKLILLGTLLLVGFPHLSKAQKDTLRLSNEDVLVGEIKYMDRGILFIKTIYSNADIQVKWKEVNTIHSESLFLITLENGERLEGNLKSISNDSLLIHVIKPTKRTLSHIELDEFENFQINKDQLVLLNEINTSFSSRFNGDISVGFNLAKANKLRQFSIKSNLGYSGDIWGGALDLNVIRSIQSSTAAIERYQGSGSILLFLPKDFFLIGVVSLLSNTQQLLELRVNSILGAGMYLIHTNHSYWNLQVGVNNNNERFQGDLPSENSFEAIIGTDINFYDVGVFNFSGSIAGYRSFLDEGRYRSDARFDVTYKFVDDFFLKLGLAFNYDSKPTEGATDFDYVVQSTLGWKF